MSKLPTAIQLIFAPIADDLARLDQVIAQRLASEVSLIQKISAYILQAGGKRLRPGLLLLFARALNYSGSQHHLLAAVVECIHMATLLHDDVVDDSSMRRGRDTTHTIFGNAASILVGDFLYSRSFQMMIPPANLRVMEIFAEATNVIAEGEVLQLLAIHNSQVSEADYLRVISCKTAKLFEAAARLGAVLAETQAPIEAAAAAYGRHLGMAFQLVDDMLDYSASPQQMGKNVGDDLREGKMTLPLIFVLHHGTPAQKNLVRGAIELGGPDAFASVCSVVQSTGALAYSRACAEQEANQARLALAALPPSVFRASLLELCAFSVERQF
jgi:octaprenyl-diphosphate synthase